MTARDHSVKRHASHPLRTMLLLFGVFLLIISLASSYVFRNDESNVVTVPSACETEKQACLIACERYPVEYQNLVCAPECMRMYQECITMSQATSSE